MESLKISENLEDTSAMDKTDTRNVSEIFDSGLALFTKILETDEPTNSFKVQSEVKRAMSLLEDATRLVSAADIFSTNESLEEVATENLKYFMLPVMLGTLVTKMCNVDDRVHLVDVAHTYFTDFLRRVKVYGITDYEVPDCEAVEPVSSEGRTSNTEMIRKMVNSRESKLERYRQRKELESRFSVLKESKDNPNIDEETKRDYFVTWIKCYVNAAIDELDALKSEKEVLEYMKNLPPDENRGTKSIHKSKAPVAKLKPIIITRDAVQKTVFGAGYPSLPVLTVQEFYEQRVKDGDWPGPSTHAHGNTENLLPRLANEAAEYPEEDLEAIDTEDQIERDDPEYLARKKAMDEYKDTHRRGWGNRANRS